MKERTAIQNGTVKTLCRMCNTRCSIAVVIKDGIMTEILPGAGNPVNDGRICPRGKTALEHFYHRDRILAPLKRMPDGSFVTIAREQALDEIAERMAALKAEYGAPAVGVWKGEGVGFLQQEGYVRRFIRGFGSPNYFSNDSACFNGRYLGNRLVTGFWNPYPRFDAARLILLLGSNPPVCHPPFMKEFADARSSGARLVVIDPRLNPIGCWADIFAQPLPGTDGALAWGLINLLVQSDAYDKDFVSRYTVGFSEIAAYARRFTPEVVEAESGIYADVVRTIAEMIADSRPEISIYLGTGLEHHENGVNNIRALTILSCLCGALDTECGLYWPERMPLAELSSRKDPSPSAPLPIGADRFPVLYDFTGEGHTMTAMDYMLGMGEYPLKGLVITAANPVVTHPDTLKVERAFKNLDLLVANDFFLTRTARLAHYVLPAETFLERSEIHCNIKYHRVYLTRKVAEIPGIENEYRFWHDLAHRLGFGEDCFPWKNETEVNRYLLAPSDITLEDLKAHPGGIVYQPVRYRKHETAPLPTPSGKVEFASGYLKGLGFSEIPEYIPPFHLRERADDYPFLLTTGARMTLFYHSRHQNIARFRLIHRRPEAEIHPDDAEAIGIADGDMVRLSSRLGSIEVAARIVHRAELRRGVVEVYHGWEDQPVNILTFGDVNDPISGFPLLKAVPVRIEKLASQKAVPAPADLVSEECADPGFDD